jgi:hypothetical protein
MLVNVPQNNWRIRKLLIKWSVKNLVLRHCKISYEQKLKSPIAWKAKNLRTSKFYIKQIL